MKNLLDWFHCIRLWGLVSSEAENVMWMKDIICNLTFPTSLVVDSPAGGFQQLSPVRFYHITDGWFECDLDEKWVASRLAQLDLIFASQVLKKKLNTTGEDDVQQSAPIFFKAIEKVDLKMASMCGHRLLPFLFCKGFPCIYSSIYQQIIWRIVFTIRPKTC